MGNFDDLFAQKVSLTLTKEEALVLFEMLHEVDDEPVIPIRGNAERRTVWNVTCCLEKMLVEPFMSNYGDIVKEARRRLTDPSE